MPGIHSITLMWQAVAHGLTTPSLESQIYASFMHTANGSSSFRSGWGRRRVNSELIEMQNHDGVLYDGENNTQTVSEALEYAINWHCLARMARRMGDGPAHARFARLASVYRILYDRDAGFFAGRRRDGTRVYERRPFHASSSSLWTEGSALQWLFHVQHDFDGLLHMLGRPLLTSRLRLLFTLANGTTDVPDATGLIGHYAQGNEPSHHVIFWWFRLGQPAVAYELLERAMAFYTDQDTGLTGNDDAGAMSAWLVCAVLGTFPVDPTNSTWLTFRPRAVGRVSLHPHRCDACAPRHAQQALPLQQAG